MMIGKSYLIVIGAPLIGYPLGPSLEFACNNNK
jgi:hypothetical protein